MNGCIAIGMVDTTCCGIKMSWISRVLIWLDIWMCLRVIFISTFLFARPISHCWRFVITSKPTVWKIFMIAFAWYEQTTLLIVILWLLAKITKISFFLLILLTWVNTVNKISMLLDDIVVVINFYLRDALTITITLIQCITFYYNLVIVKK